MNIFERLRRVPRQGYMMLAIAGLGVLSLTACSDGTLPDLEPIRTTITEVGAVAEGLNVDGLAARVGEWANEPVTIGGADRNATFVPPTRNPNEPTVGETLAEIQPTIDAARDTATQFVGGVVGTVVETVVSAGNTYVQRVQAAANSGVSFEDAVSDLGITISGLIPGSLETGNIFNASVEVRDVLPDPGPGVTEMVQIITREALKRGIPPEYALAKLWYEGGYFWDPVSGQQVDAETPGRVWVGLRNVNSNGNLVTSYAGCAGVGQVCPQWHPEYDLERAKRDPEYAVAFALDFMNHLYGQTGTWNGVTGRYHSPAEAAAGQQLTREFLTNPPINPETGQPAWQAQSAEVLNETSRRPILTPEQIDALQATPEVESTPTPDPEAGGSAPAISEPELFQWAQYYQANNPAPWKWFVVVCQYRGCNPKTDPERAQKIWDELSESFVQATDPEDTETILRHWAQSNNIPEGELSVIQAMHGNKFPQRESD